MIVFSVAFGEPYVSRLFTRCLPSLFANGADLAEPVRVLLVTAEEDGKDVACRAEACAALEDIAVEVISIDFPPAIPIAERKDALLARAVRYCLEADESFAFAVPDLVYSKETLATAWHLHRLTGKTIATFNGRVHGDMLDEDLVAHARTDLAVLFFAYMNPVWAAQRTDDPDKIRGEQPGHLIADGPGYRAVFCPAPNPFLGKFTPADAALLWADFKHWDHEWRETLARENRLLVIQNLDVAMTVEPETKPKRGYACPDPASPEENAAARAKKFAEPTYLFQASCPRS